MNVFTVRDRLIGEYAQYVRSFMHVRDPRIAERVEEGLRLGLLWPEPLLQLNPSFEPGKWVDELVAEGALHPECALRPQGEAEGGAVRLRPHESSFPATQGTDDQNQAPKAGNGRGPSHRLPTDPGNHKPSSDNNFCRF